MPIIAWCFHQVLPATPFQAPDSRESGVEGKLHFILEIEICAGQQLEQFHKPGRKLRPQISFD